MSHNLDDSVAAHAIGALPEDEEVIVEAAVEFEDSLKSQYEAHRRVAEWLVDGLLDDSTAPPADLWDRIESATDTDNPANNASLWRRRLLPIGAVALVASFALAGLLVTTRNDPNAMQALATEASQSAGATTVVLDATTIEGVSAEAVITSDGASFLDGNNLPTLAEGSTYQLWAIIDDRVVSVGVLGSRPTMSSFRVEGVLNGLAITEEISGGVVTSSNDPVAVWLAAG